jgi:hypothetical protein
LPPLLSGLLLLLIWPHLLIGLLLSDFMLLH